MLNILIVLGLLSKIDTIRIVYTSNIIGQFGIRGATFINPTFPPPLGGAGSFLTYLKQARKEFPNLLLFDAGNMVGGYVSGQEIDLEKPLKFYKMMGYNAMVPGWREFFKGENKITELANRGIVFLAANLKMKQDSDRYFPGVKPYKIFNVNGVKVGVFGLTSDKMPLFADDWWLNNALFQRDIDIAKKMVKELRSMGADIIILLSATGMDREKLIADSVSGIDFIFGGFMGWGFREPYENWFTHTVIFRLYNYFSSALQVDIYYDAQNRCVIGYKAKQISLMMEDYPPDPKAAEVFYNKPPGG